MEVGSFADWVSGLGSMAAVGASYYMHRQSVFERRQLEASQARSAALAVLPPFREAHREFAWTAGRLVEGHKPDKLGTDQYQQNIDMGDLIRHQRELAPHLTTIGLLGSAAPAAQSAYRAIEKLADELGRYGVGADDGDWIYVGSAWPDTEAHFRYTAELVAAATREIERLTAVTK